MNKEAWFAFGMNAFAAAYNLGWFLFGGGIVAAAFFTISFTVALYVLATNY